MKYQYKFLSFLSVFIFFVLLSHENGNGVEYTSKRVKVLLDSCEAMGRCRWSIKSSDGFFISDPDNPQVRFFCASKKIKISLKHNSIYINGKKFLRHKLKIVPNSGDLTFKGNAYQGHFVISLNEKMMLLINNVDLEDYVFAVLRSESWPGWPIEVNKVFAVAIRSYAIYKIREAMKCKREYDIGNTNLHQTYNGHEFMVRNGKYLRMAVEQTKGTFLAYNNEPIVAMFDSCCGGVIPALIDGSVDFKKAPYLARNYSCDYCKKCSLYSWKVTYNLAELERLLSEKCSKISGIKSIWVSRHDKDKAGLVKKVTIKGKKHSWVIPGEKVYSLLKDVTSFCFSVKRGGQEIIFSGRGYGHHIGLCQWGARQMVRELWGYKKILQFYYPGTTFMQLV